MQPRGNSALAAALRATTPEVLRAGNHDAVVIGAGAAGGLAAMLLAEAGLRVLVLEAGSGRSALDLPPTRAASRPDSRRQPIQSRCYAWPLAPKAFVDDVDCPYSTPADRPFVWLRARQLGGRLAVPGHGRQYYRLGPGDLAPRDGLSLPWPLPSAELDPWYTLVERRLGLAGSYDNIPWLPDSELLRVLKPTLDEAALQSAICAEWPGARPILGRFAPPPDTLELAARTGRLLIRTGAIAREVEVDNFGHVRGVIWVDEQTLAAHRAATHLVFLCASALESTRLLLLSRSRRRPGGLDSQSGALGHYLMDHIRISARGVGPPLLHDRPFEPGRCIYLPRFDARASPTIEPGRGFAVQLYREPAGTCSHFSAVSFAEMLPRFENRVTLDHERNDAWGIPVLRIECAHGSPELTRMRDQIAALRNLFELAGITLTSIDEVLPPPGIAIHESGTARMGSDPESSVLDPHNQCWDAQGLYLTDAACFPSQSFQNPTLTILALTARACHHALQTRRQGAPEVLGRAAFPRPALSY